MVQLTNSLVSEFIKFPENVKRQILIGLKLIGPEDEELSAVEQYSKGFRRAGERGQGHELAKQIKKHISA